MYVGIYFTSQPKSRVLGVYVWFRVAYDTCAVVSQRASMREIVDDPPLIWKRNDGIHLH